MEGYRQSSSQSVSDYMRQFKPADTLATCTQHNSLTVNWFLQVTPVLCDSVARWQEVVPVAAALRNPVMQDRHWTKLQQELGIMLPAGPAFTLQTLFDLKVSRLGVTLISCCQDLTPSYRCRFTPAAFA